MEQRQTGSQRFPHYQRHIGVSRFLLTATMVLAICQCRLAAQAFEVASIRENPGPWHVLVGYSSSGPRLMLEGWRVSNLIEEAFHLKRYEFTTPPSSNDIVYNIEAKAEGNEILTRDEF